MGKAQKVRGEVWYDRGAVPHLLAMLFSALLPLSSSSCPVYPTLAFHIFSRIFQVFSTDF